MTQLVFPKSAKLITLEGIEGTGKSSCFQYISDFLTKANIPHQLTREPGGTEIAEAIRQVLLNQYQEKMCVDAETLLLFASRAQHLNRVVVPALQRGDWVVSDRYIDSSYAYQGFGRGVGAERIALLQQWLSEFVSPHLVILLDAPVELALERARLRQSLDRIESEEIEFFQKIREGYLYRAKHHPNTAVIDATQEPEKVMRQIQEILEELRV